MWKALHTWEIFIHQQGSFPISFGLDFFAKEKYYYIYPYTLSLLLLFHHMVNFGTHCSNQKCFKNVVTHLFKNFHLLLRTCSFIIMFKPPYKWNLSWASWTLYSLISSLFTTRFNILLWSRTSILIAGFQIKVLYEFLKLILIYCESVLQSVELML
jgi:hypothetical protein